MSEGTEHDSAMAEFVTDLRGLLRISSHGANRHIAIISAGVLLTVAYLKLAH